MQLKTKISHKNLASQLNTDDLALILLHMSNQDCNYNESKEDLSKFKRNLSQLSHSLNDFLKEYKDGFVFRACLSEEYSKRNKNIDAIFELMKEKEGVKRKYLELNYYAVEHLINANLIKKEGNDYHDQILYPTKELEDIINPFLDEDGRGNFELINEALIIYLTKYFHDVEIKPKERY